MGLSGLSALTGLIERMITYLVRDLFTTDRATGAVNGTAADPTGGTRAVIDTNSKLSISAGALQLAGGKATPAWGDPALAYPSLTRAAGLQFVATVNVSAGDGPIVGWSNNQNLTDISTRVREGVRTRPNSGNTLYAYSNAATPVIGAHALSTAYDMYSILRASGSFALIQGGVWVYPTLLYVGVGDTTATLFPGVYSNSAVGTADNVQVRQLSGNFASDYGIATARTVSPAALATQATEADFLVEATWTAATGVTFELDMKYLDADNRWIVRCAQAGSTVKLIQREAGVETERATAAQTWTNAVAYRIVALMDREQNTCMVFVADTRTLIYTSASYNTGARLVRISHAVSNLVTYPRNVDPFTGIVRANPTPNRAYVKNAAAPLTIPTYDGSGQAIHPDVIDFGVGQTWNGYRYWMAMTPYTNTDNTTENPSIVVSTDGLTWIVPSGLTNPVISYAGGGLYNADTDIIMVGSTMWMIWKFVSSAGVSNETRAATSTDGTTWTLRGAILSGVHDFCLSPAVIFDGTRYVMFSINGVGTNTFERRTCATMNGTWSAPTTISMPFEPWHVDVIRDTTGILYGVMNIESSYYLHFGYSTDNGLTWTWSTSPILTNVASGGWPDGNVYRSTIVKTATGFDLWYSGKTLAGAWGTAFAKIGY